VTDDWIVNNLATTVGDEKVGLYPGIAPGWGYYFKPTNKPIYTYYYA